MYCFGPAHNAATPDCRPRPPVRPRGRIGTSPLPLHLFLAFLPPPIVSLWADWWLLWLCCSWRAPHATPSCTVGRPPPRTPPSQLRRGSSRQAGRLHHPIRHAVGVAGAAEGEGRPPAATDESASRSSAVVGGARTNTRRCSCPRRRWGRRRRAPRCSCHRGRWGRRRRGGRGRRWSATRLDEAPQGGCRARRLPRLYEHSK